ncbi:DUF6076 domain-containing protein [Streptococcus equi]|uniref:DUF6076 domain-containing protein n=1 Tax=Streptococcus equi TaxID=1336 RepID=UPI0039C6EC31
MSLRKCKNCDRYFIVRYSSLAEYCLRKVEGTHANCQEYASKKTYKKKNKLQILYIRYSQHTTIESMEE